MTTIEELERRVQALETAQKQTAETQEWMAATLVVRIERFEPLDSC